MLNTVSVYGHLTHDPEVKHVASGTAVCELSLAVNDRRKTADGKWEDRPSFFQCVCFGKTAEIAGEYLHKGSPAILMGKLHQDRWQDKTSGQNRSKVVIWVEHLTLVGSPTNKREQSPAAPGNRESPRDTHPPHYDQRDIPF